MKIKTKRALQMSKWTLEPPRPYTAMSGERWMLTEYVMVLHVAECGHPVEETFFRGIQDGTTDPVGHRVPMEEYVLQYWENSLEDEDN